MDVLVLTDCHQDGQFRVIHIPLSLYPALLQPILQILVPAKTSGRRGSHEHRRHDFLNITITPIECSIVCRAAQVQSIFAPRIAALAPADAARVHVSRTIYNVFSVNSAGLEAGRRVLDLTAPLALAGIPIFFITTYHTDFILVPSTDRQRVGAALLARGLEFSASDAAYVSPTTSVSTRHSSGSTSAAASPTSPLPVDGLQKRALTQLRRHGVMPFLVPGLQVVQVSGREGQEYAEGRVVRDPPSWLSDTDSRLYLGLVTALIQPPRFLSITRGQDDAPSILIDAELLERLGDAVTGDLDAVLAPIFLDLVDLPLESTGIVCGVAGQLAEEICTSSEIDDAPELSYLSTARAGAVMLPAAVAERALKQLQQVMATADDEKACDS